MHTLHSSSPPKVYQSAVAGGKREEKQNGCTKYQPSFFHFFPRCNPVSPRWSAGRLTDTHPFTGPLLRHWVAVVLVFTRRQRNSFLLFFAFFVHNSMPSFPSFLPSLPPSFFLSFFFSRLFLLSPSRKDRRTRGNKSVTIRAYSSISMQPSIWTEFWSLRERVGISGCVSGGIWSKGIVFPHGHCCVDVCLHGEVSERIIVWVPGVTAVRKKLDQLLSLLVGSSPTHKFSCPMLFLTSIFELYLFSLVYLFFKTKISPR